MPTIESALNPIDQVKQEISKLIRSEPYFDNIDVLTDEAGDLDVIVLNALQKVGIGIVVEVASGKIKEVNIGSQAVDLKCVVTVQENVLINRDPNNVSASGKRATDLICELLALFNPINGAVPIVFSDFDLVSNMGGVITYQANGTVQAGWKRKQ